MAFSMQLLSQAYPVDKDDLKIAQDIELVESQTATDEQSAVHGKNGDNTVNDPAADLVEKYRSLSDDTFSSDEMFSGDDTLHRDEDTLSGDDTLSGEDDISAGPISMPEARKNATKLKGTAYDVDRLLGKVVGGHYQILAYVGEGGMSRIYKAKHLHLNKDVAIKFLAVGRQFDAKAIARFQKEANAASELQHPSICSTREFGVDENGIPYLVMDYVEGISLSELLWKEKTIQPPQAIDIMIGVCRGLEHAHDQGVIHRDIKPANIILTKDRSGLDAVKLVDFGIAKLIRDDESGPDLTQTGEVFGTPKYMSPEQCLGKTVDQRADIYALGCIFYEMFAGRAPFYNESALQILFSHINDHPQEIIEKCGKNVQAILNRCLQKDPARRYQRVSELLADLEAVRAGRPPVYAQYKPSADPNIVISMVILTVTMSVIFFAFTALTSNHQKAMSDTAAWETAHSKAVEYRTRNKLIAAEAALEESLAIAKSSRNESLVALTLQELSDVETALGKTHQAAEHSKSLSSKIKGNSISSLFMSFAFLLIAAATVMAISAVLLFGKSQASLEEFFRNKRM
jgi:serine/threonine protein kinase